MSQDTGDDFRCDTPHPSVVVRIDHYFSCNHFRPTLFGADIARRFGKSFFLASTQFGYHQVLCVVLLFGGRQTDVDSTID